MIWAGLNAEGWIQICGQEYFQEYFKENTKFSRINDQYINESILNEIYEILENDFSEINKTGVERYFNDKYQIKVEIIKEILKNYEDIEISNKGHLNLYDSNQIPITSFYKNNNSLVLKQMNAQPIRFQSQTGSDILVVSANRQMAINSCIVQTIPLFYIIFKHPDWTV